MIRFAGVFAVLAMAAGLAVPAQAQNATWLASPGSGDFNTGSNWAPAAVPTGTASFGTSNTTGISTSTSTTVGGFTFNSGASAYSVTLGSDFTFSGAGIVNNSGSAQTLNVGAQTITFSNNSSAGSQLTLNASGGGTTNFFDNSTAGSATINNSGSGTTLNFDDSASAGSATITNSAGATFCFCNNATAGSATITNTGAGSTLTFVADSSAGSSTITNATGASVLFRDTSTGGTARYIGTGGTLDISNMTQSLPLGSIEGSGTVSLGANNLAVGGNNRSTTFSGTIADGGDAGGVGGSLTKTGTGTLTLSGANTYTGGTTVSQGALMVTGSLASGVTVSSGGTLGGSGTINGAVVNSGTVAPGNVNTLSVNGNYTQNSGGTYQVVVNGAGQSGKLSITGSATLGGTVNVQAVSGSYVKNTTYTILTVTGTITGTFAGVTSNFAFLTPSLTHSSNSVSLTLSQGANAFAAGGQTGNQRAVGAVLDQASATATGDFAKVLDAIIVLDTVQGPRVLDAIGGQNYAGFSTVSVQSAAAFMNAFASQVGGGTGGDNRRVAVLAGADDACDAVCDVDLPRWGVWGGGIGGAGTVAGDASSHGTTYNFGGFAGGLDYRFDPKVLAGVVVGYTAANLYTQGMDGTGHSGTVQLGLYGQFTEGQIYVDGLAGYARGQNQMQRPIAIPGLQPRTASSQTTVDQFFGQLEGGYKIELGGMAQAFFTPFARVQASTATQAAFAETGADSLNLNVAGQTTNSLRSVVGAVLGGSIGKATTRFRLGWSHEFADPARPVTASFAGAPALSFTTTGASAPREGAVLGLSVDAPLAEQTSLYARYDGELAGGNTSHIFSAGVRYVW
jgi:autotransporter-associated beta strand protein